MVMIRASQGRKSVDIPTNIFCQSRQFSDGYINSLHTARRSCITALADFGVNIYTIQRIAGHARISTTQKYIQLSTATIEADLRKAFPKDRQIIIPEAVPLPKEIEFAEAEEVN
jgi:integrase